MDVYHTPPSISFTLTVAEAKALFEDLEDVHEATSGPGISTTTVRLMGELGAELEDGGYLDDDEDPDPEPEPSNVIPVDFAPRETATDPAVKTWQVVFEEANRKAFAPFPYGPRPIKFPYDYKVTC